jgi:hypothetical protein
MIFYSLILSLALLRLPSATARSFTVVNTCTYTIWYAPVYLVILSRRVPRRSDLSLAVMQARSGCIPAIPAFHRFLNSISDLHRPLRRKQCTTVPNWARFQHLPLLAIPLMYIYRWESPPSTSAQFSVPDDWKSGRIWVRIFPLLPNSLTAGAWLHSLSDLRARALLFRWFSGPPTV